jgi:hypothetical protein
MGLLDDAIREHLELKRLSGADPGVVAREENDALGPVRRGGEEDDDSQENSEAKLLPDPDGLFSPDSEPGPVADSSTAGQETVEINMEAELAAGSDSGQDASTTRTERAASATNPAPAQPGAEDSLEWEVPSDRASGPGDGSGLDGETDSHEDEGGEAGEQVEDVLEETPDFLRDTPEQERLWFEQRPPRDFDFNE